MASGFRVESVNLLKLFLFLIQHSKLCLNGVFVQTLRVRARITLQNWRTVLGYVR